MLMRLFVTGTDTDVGKTVVSRGLMQAFIKQGNSVAGYKPVAEGGIETHAGIRNKDALILQAAASLPLPYEAVNPILCREDVFYAQTTPEPDYDLMSSGLRSLATQVDTIVVEGSGGWRMLMNDLRPYSAWVIQEQLPVVLVVGIKLGCVNHALLTAQAIVNDGLPLVGWVANRINPGLGHYSQTIAVLQQQLSAPLLGEVPYLPRSEERELAQYLNLSPLYAFYSR